jgi:uncharacterized membrane protein
LPETRESPAAVPIDRPWHPFVLALPLTCFVGAMVTDIVYARTFDTGWKNFSDWLLAAGMIVGALGAIVGIVDLARRSVRANRLIWPYAIIYAVAMLLGLFDNFIHSRDAYGAMPAGLTLSVLTVVALLATAVLGFFLLYPSRDGAVW